MTHRAIVIHLSNFQSERVTIEFPVEPTRPGEIGASAADRECREGVKDMMSELEEATREAERVALGSGTSTSGRAKARRPKKR